MWLLAMVGCDPSPQGAPRGSDSPEPPAWSPPPDEVACSGADEDLDGLANFEEGCVARRPDVVLRSPPFDGCCVRWSVVPDVTADGASDVLLEHTYDLGRDAVGASAWLLPATERGRADELAVAWFTFPGLDDNDAGPNPGLAGEFDGAAGADVWVRGHLFAGDPVGSLTAADADATSATRLLWGGDLDADGAADLLGFDFDTGAGTLMLALGPFAGADLGWVPLAAPADPWPVVLDADGDGRREVAHPVGGLPPTSTVRLVDTDGGWVADFPHAGAGVTPVGDLDGDGFDDVIVGDDAISDQVVSVFAGPFAGTFDRDTHARVAVWRGPDIEVGVPDLDGDGIPELVSRTYDGFGVLPTKYGGVHEYTPNEARWWSDAHVNSVPSGGPFVAQLGGDPAADLAAGVFEETWNDEFHIWLQPLY